MFEPPLTSTSGKSLKNPTEVTHSNTPAKTNSVSTNTESTQFPLIQVNNLDTPDSSQGEARKRGKPNMIYIFMFLICIYLQLCTFAKLYSSEKEAPKVEGKWSPRHLSLPMEIAPPMLHIEDGDILKLDRIITSYTLTVTVLYAPWSRASLRVVRDLSHLATTSWNENNTVGFLAINCWLYQSLCRDNLNSWEYPQILLYHRETSYVPHSCFVNTSPAVLTAHIHSLVNPVTVVRSLGEVGEVIGKYQCSVIGLFGEDYTTNKEYREFRRAAVHHHFENYDIHHVPFIVLTSQHYSDLLDKHRRSYLIFKHVLFEPLASFDSRFGKLKFVELLKWLKVIKPAVQRLNIPLFPMLTNNSESVILVSPLHKRTENYVSFLRNILSYQHCRIRPEYQVNYKAFRNCTSRYYTDRSTSKEKTLPYFVPDINGNTDNLALLASGPRHPASLSHDLLPDHTLYDEGVVGCGRQDGCDECDHVDTDTIEEELEHYIDEAVSQLMTRHHGSGCRVKRSKFYVLDSVDWEDLVGLFGGNESHGSDAEVLVKVKGREERLFSIDLSSRSLTKSEDFFAFTLGRNEDNENYEVNRWVDQSEDKNEKTISSESRNEPGEETKGKFLKEISYSDVRALETGHENSLLFVYSKWCGYCHIVQRKLEVVSRLSLTPGLSFVKIDTDSADNLRGTSVKVETVPRVFLFRGDAFPIVSMKLDHKKLSVKTVIEFITRYLPNAKFSDSLGDQLPAPPSLPCRPWIPAVKPSPQARAPPVEQSAYFEKTAIERLLEEVGKSREEKAAEEDGVSDEMSLNRATMCHGSLNMFKVMSVNAPVSPYDRAPALINLVYDMHYWKCLHPSAGKEVYDMWEWVGAACSRSPWSEFPCKYLLTASHIANRYHVTPPEILAIFRNQILRADRSHQLAVSSAKRSKSHDMPAHSISEFEMFYLSQCYNVQSEFVFFINKQCSDICRLTCRIIHELIMI